MHALATVDDDVLGHHTSLVHAHFRMVAASSKQTRRFDVEVGDFLLVTIHDAEAVLCCKLVFTLFDRLQQATLEQ